MMIDRIYLEVMWSEFVDPSDYESCLLGDVLDRYEKLPHAEVYTDNSLVIVKAWKDKRKPIEEQPELAIEYIYNLLI